VSKKKKKKGKPFNCLGCMKGMDYEDPKCKRCGRPNPGYSVKASAPVAFIAKSAGGKVVPIRAAKSARPVCHCGHRGGRFDKCCTACGLQYGISDIALQDRVLKASGVTPAGYWAAQSERQNDPGQREQMRDMAFKSGRQPTPEDIAIASGYSSLYDAVIRCNQPEARSFFMNAYYGTPGGAA
jgi:hypothetical protein